ncbi:Di-copper centre-containing protein [Bimuria novae-zelandiae CBS 107.79]|uniref:tyrosinase n=1 Tax=Bimuria novae-zelandiae CBS 107.79 TaxID=1447943 RepID=A0A6A5V9S9_9PLEO|nr:Di-copper centre-containing protein [Bimuria novae-zelandiae CBS 107.79]
MVAYSKPRSFASMLLAVFVLLQVTVAFSHNGHMHPAHRSPAAMDSHLEDTRSMLVERAGNVQVKGAPDGQFPRLEIRELKKNADQWNLFLLAMERFQNKPKNDPMSYYQIAGIHGRPYLQWNGAGMKHTGGYCPHGQNTFGSWHRPYLSVYEQAVYLNAQEVVASFPRNQQGRWQSALRGLRIPYFDWAAEPPRGEPAVPTSIRDQTVSVIKPQGRVTIRNPLYSYSWGNSLPSEMGWGPSNGYPTTLRRPVSNRSDNYGVNAIFGQARVGWRQRVFALFASGQPWGRASTAAFGVKTIRSNADSFESIHDDIHGQVGGVDGHMAYLDVAAFDPFFWLHHTNIDRLLTMYQMVVPNTYVIPGRVNRDMAQWDAGQLTDANTPLVPFLKNSRSAYSSNDVKETRVLGYYYPETASRSRQEVIRAVNRLYGQGERPMWKRDGEDAAPIYPGRPFKAGDYDTVLSVVGDKFGMPGSYQVHCFLGAQPSNGTAPSHLPTGMINGTAPTVKPINGTTGNGTSNFEYGFDSTYVGSHTFLGGSVAGSGNGTAPTLVEGSIPITAALQEKEANGELASLHPDHVEPYIKENLSYKIVGPNGQEFAPEDIPNFHVQVKSCEVQPSASEDELPEYKDYIELPRAQLPASQPWTYTPGPLDTTPDTPAVSDEGYCVSKQTIRYVDPDGNFLYEEVV